MKIQGTFNSRLYNSQIEVTILTNHDSGQTLTISGNKDSSIQFSSNPVEIENNLQNTFDIFSKTSATISLLVKNYTGDLFFTSDPTANLVNISRNGKCIFAGYLTPCSYSQQFSSTYDTLTLNCVDGLSVLQNYQYDDITAENFDQKYLTASNHTFLEYFQFAFSKILKNNISDLDSSCHVYFDNSKCLNNSTLDASIFKNLGVSDLNFMKSDADSTLNYEDILTQILTYLNLHIVQQGFDYYIFDWNTLKTSNKITWTDILAGTILTYTPKTITLTGDIHVDDNTNITVDDVYNTIKVKDSITSQTDAITSPLDSQTLTSNYKQTQLYMTEYATPGSGESSKNSINDIINGRTSNYNYKITDWYCQVMSNKYWHLYYLDSSNEMKNIDNLMDIDNQGNYYNQLGLLNYVSHNPLTPVLVDFGSTDVSLDSDEITSSLEMTPYLYISVNGNEYDDANLVSPTDSSLKAHSGMIEYVGKSSGGTYSPPDEKSTNYLVFDGKITLQPIAYESTAAGFLSRNGTFSDDKNSGIAGTEPLMPNSLPLSENLNGSNECYYVRQFYDSSYPIPDASNYYLQSGYSLQPPSSIKMGPISSPQSPVEVHWSVLPYTNSTIHDGKDYVSKLMILECELMIGNKYCVETIIDSSTDAHRTVSKFEWLTMDQIKNRSDLTYVDDISGETMYQHTFTLGVNPEIGDYILNKDYDMQNTVSYLDNISGKGTAIPIKESDHLAGALIFRILGPVNSIWDNDIIKRHKTWFRHTSYTTASKFVLSHIQNIIIKDFTCKLYSDNSGYTTNLSKDLIYMSTDDNDYSNNKNEITFDLTTQLTADESYEKQVNNSIYLNSVIDYTQNTPVRTIFNRLTGNTAKAEEHYISQYYQEYNIPRIIQDVNLKYDDTYTIFDRFHSNPLLRDFFVEKMKIEVQEDTCEVTMKEINIEN